MTHRRWCLFALLGTSVLGCGEATPPSLPKPRNLDPTWVMTEDMLEPRINHGAVALADGRVLVAGGFNATGTLATAEIYDPTTGTWAPAGKMRHARAFFAATLLSDGRALVAGGTDVAINGKLKAILDTAEIFDPALDAEDAWQETAQSMLAAHTASTATTLADGEVLVVGGRGTADLDIAETFDPATGAWTLTSTSPAKAYHDHTATLMPDGRVAIIGGYDPTAPLADLDIYDPESRSFQPAASMTVARKGHVAARLRSGPHAGGVLVLGGQGLDYKCFKEGAALDYDAEDPAASTWRPGPTMREARIHATLVELSTAELLVAGGQRYEVSPAPPTEAILLASAEAFDPASDALQPMPPMHLARVSHTMTPIRGGSAALVVGGTVSAGDTTTSAEIFYRNGPCGSGLDCSPGGICFEGHCATPETR